MSKTQYDSGRALRIFSLVMIIAIGGSTLFSLFSNKSTSSTQPTATIDATPTLPAPIADLTAISFAQDYLHPTGLFTVAQPSGYLPSSPTSGEGNAEITFNNAEQLSVIQVSVQIPAEAISDLDKLDALYTQSTLNPSWSNYRRDAQTGLNYRETSRTRDGNKIVMDFELQNGRRQTFLARQVSWFDESWVYMVRVVVPVNDIPALKYLIDNEVSTLRANKVFAGIPANWQGYFDPSTNWVIRYPNTWAQEDGGIGRPATISGADGVLRVEALPAVTVADAAAAEAWVTATRAGVTILNTAPVTRGDLSGFSVAYSYTTPDGAAQSGLALILNAADGAHVANLRLNKAAVDLNAADAATTYPDWVNMLGSFQQLTGVKVPLPTPTPTFTPGPTSTSTNTPEPTATFTATNTPEPTATSTNTNTPEPTATDVPTNTPIPPTATDVPPTATPLPSATPVPATATLAPSATP